MAGYEGSSVVEDTIGTSQSKSHRLRLAIGSSQMVEIKGLAEREGFDYRHFLQVAAKPKHSDNSLCLCWFQALFQFRVRCLRRPLTTSFDHQNGITGITFRG